MDSFDEFAAAVGEGADGSDDDAVVSVAVTRIAVSEGNEKLYEYTEKLSPCFFTSEFGSKISCHRQYERHVASAAACCTRVVPGSVINLPRPAEYTP